MDPTICLAGTSVGNFPLPIVCLHTHNDLNVLKKALQNKEKS